MKNVTKLSQTEVFREKIPRLVLSSELWAIKYLSGIDESAETKPGHWLVQWDPPPERIAFGFSKDRHLYYTERASAQAVSDMLRKDMEIEAEVVKV
jgi:hypothetical protein